MSTLVQVSNKVQVQGNGYHGVTITTGVPDNAGISNGSGADLKPDPRLKSEHLDDGRDLYEPEIGTRRRFGKIRRTKKIVIPSTAGK